MEQHKTTSWQPFSKRTQEYELYNLQKEIEKIKQRQ
jgi:hypothetical protein